MKRRPFALMGCILVSLCVLPACSSLPPSETAGLHRLDVIPGQTLIVPMDDTWPTRAGGRVTGWLDTGERVQGTVYRLNVSVENDPTQDRASRWLMPPGVWTSGDRPTLAPEQRDQLLGTTRVLAITLPVPDARVPRTLRVLDRDFAIHYLPTAEACLEPLAEPGRGDPWAPTTGPAGAVSPILAAIAWPEALSPVGRWRFRMMSGTLRPEQDPPPFDLVKALQEPARRASDGVGGLQPFEDPVIEALARQYDSRWRIALAQLWATDADLAGRVKRRLAGVVDFGNGYVAPAWPTDHAAIEALLLDVLDPNLDAAQRTWRAESWLSLQPAAVAWIVDDAGTIDAATGRGIGTACVANLTDVSTLAWVSSSENETASLSPLPPHAVQRLLVEPVQPSTPRPAWRPEPTASCTKHVFVHAGRWRESLTLVEGRLHATPPGLSLGPLLPDYTMTTWLARSAPAPSRPEWLTAAMLHKVASPTGLSRWELFVECLSHRPGESPQADVVRVWIGPLGQPLAVFRIDGTGQIADEARRPDLVHTPGDVRIVRTSDRWSFRMILPAKCIENDGTLRLGLTRTDPTASRSAWPRPMLPWHDEPGRLAIETRTWE